MSRAFNIYIIKTDYLDTRVPRVERWPVTLLEHLSSHLVLVGFVIFMLHNLQFSASTILCLLVFFLVIFELSVVQSTTFCYIERGNICIFPFRYNEIPLYNCYLKKNEGGVGQPLQYIFTDTAQSIERCKKGGGVIFCLLQRLQCTLSKSRNDVFNVKASVALSQHVTHNGTLHSGCLDKPAS